MLLVINPVMPDVSSLIHSLFRPLHQQCDEIYSSLFLVLTDLHVYVMFSFIKINCEHKLHRNAGCSTNDTNSNSYMQLDFICDQTIQ